MKKENRKRIAIHHPLQRLSAWAGEHFQVRLFLVFTAISLFSVVALILLTIGYQTRTLNHDLMVRGRLFSEILANNSRLGVFSENKEMLDDLVKGLIQQQHVLYIDIFSDDGRRLAHGENILKPDWALILEPFEAYREKNSYFQVTDRENQIDFWVPVLSKKQSYRAEMLFLDDTTGKDFDRIIGYTRIIIDKEPLRRAIKSLRLKIIFAALLFWMAGSVLLFILIGRVVEPLNRLTEVVTGIGETGGFREIPVETTDEIGGLARAFNRMVASLEKRENEKRRLENQLRLAQKMEAIGTLSGGIAHDFNNILGAIVGHSELAQMEAGDNEQLKERVSEILNAGIRGGELVRQILTFSRQAETTRGPILAGVIIKEVTKLLRPSLPGHVDIQTDVDPNCGMLISDATAIHQIVMNLCTNALHAMKETPGTIAVALYNVSIAPASAEARQQGIAPGRYQKLQVADNGHGIDPDIMERIFDPFFTTKRAGEGTGMGLSVVHGIVKSHNGYIFVDSEPGKGARFDVYLPLMDMDRPVEKKTASPEAARGSETILLVDDEPSLLEATREILEQLGYTVFVTRDGGEALMLFSPRPDTFDLILADMAMPRMTGLELAMAVGDIRSDIPFIILTGFSSMIDEKAAAKLGVRKILLKPVVRMQLAAAIRNVLDGDG